MNVSEYIKTHGVQHTVEKFNLSHKEDDYYYLLKYQQTKSPLNEDIVTQCRGTIFDKDTNEIVSMPFIRFNNLKLDDKINFSEYRVFEKTDGTMVNVWYSNKLNQWIVSTTGSLYSNNLTRLGDKTISELFWSVCKDLNVNVSKLEIGKSYVFELATIYNQVVNEYDTPQLKLLLVRNSNLQEEVIDSYATELNIEIPNEYIFESIEDMHNSLKNVKLGDKNFEGYVIVKEYGNSFSRYKVKSNTYIVHHQLNGDNPNINSNGFSKYRLIDVVRNNEIEEVSINFPILADNLNAIQCQLLEFKKMLNPTYNRLLTEFDNKTFFVEASKSINFDKRLKPLLLVFSLMNKNRSLPFEEAFNKIDSKKLFKLLTLDI